MHKLIGHLGGSYKVTMSVTVEKRKYHGDHSYRAAEVSKTAHCSAIPTLTRNPLGTWLCLNTRNSPSQPKELHSVDDVVD